MPKIEMKVLKAHVYAGRRHQPGDRYQAIGASDARLVAALGWAAESPQELSPPELPPAAPPPRAVPSEPAKPTEPAGAGQSVPASTTEDGALSEKPKRQYKRRDMTADEV